MKLNLLEDRRIADARLKYLSFEKFPSQPNTPAFGNCMTEALLDQCRYNEKLEKFAKDISEFRRKIVLNGFDMFIATERLTWSYDPEIGNPGEWVDKMLSDGVDGDEIVLQLA